MVETLDAPPAVEPKTDEEVIELGTTDEAFDTVEPPVVERAADEAGLIELGDTDEVLDMVEPFGAKLEGIIAEDVAFELVA